MRIMTGRPPKLTPAQQSRMVFLYTIGTPPRVLAQQFGIDTSTVRAYIRGEHKNPRLRA